MKVLTVLSFIFLTSFIPQTPPATIKLEVTVTTEIQKILNHSMYIIDNGTYRNNYDSVKLVLQQLSSVYSYLENLKKEATDTTKPKK